MSVLEKKLKLSINIGMINKNESNDSSLFTRGWANKSLTPDELAGMINRGIAYCCQLTGPRNSKNFICSDILSVDIDGTRSIKEAMNDPIVQRCLTIFYTTPNHTEERHRFRLIFALPRTIDSASDMVAASRSLSLRLSGDPSATDAARIFYGSSGSKPQVFDRAIDEQLLDDLIEQGRDADQSDTKGAKSFASTISRFAVAPTQPIVTGTGKTVEFAHLDYGTRICCPFHHDNNASAFVVRSKTDTKGLRCSTCAQTFWLAGSSVVPYDFFDFDNYVREVKGYYEKHKDPGPLRAVLAGDYPIRLGMTDANISIRSEKYLRLDRLEEGLTLIKSPKGTGKTEQLRSLLAANKDATLLIGHRIALIRQSCVRLGLECYLDINGPLSRDRIGVCLDSLQRLQGRDNKLNSFKTIVIDESEQVLSHFLSDTMERENRDAIFMIFKTLLRKAKRVIALDADLNWLTFETLTKLINDDSYIPSLPKKKSKIKKQPIRTHVVLNDWKMNKPIQIYQSDRHLVADLKQSLGDKKRVFVTSNSKKQIDILSAAMKSVFKDEIREMKVTSDTVKKEDVKNFIKNPSRLALNYDLILTSPSLGTGVDITFEENSEQIDIVYGLFHSMITTHFDFDQQLARVRHPGAVKVWVTPRTFRFDTAVDVIKKDILRDTLYKNLLVEFDEFDLPVYLEDDPFFDMASLVVSQQRASKNNLKRHFIELKRHQGVTVEMIESDDVMKSVGKNLSILGKRITDTKRMQALLSTPPLKRSQFQDIAHVVEAGSVDLLPDGSITRFREHRVKRPCLIPPEARAIHHISDKDVSQADPWDTVWSVVFDPNNCSDLVAYAAHNAAFDQQWLPPDLLGSLPLICTYKAAVHIWPEAPRHINQVLRYWLGFDIDRSLADRAHRALPDAYVTAHLLRSARFDG